jgi:undecaprenyl pyrophosphate phosphatase UppP
MAKKWTVEERKKHTRDFYPEKRRKWGMMIGAVIVILLICAALGWAIKTQYDLGLVVVLVVVLIVVIVGTIFILDNQFYETW